MKPVSSYASLFRPASPEERKTIRESLMSIGQQEPIELYHDEVLDGRTRQELLTELGMTPDYREIAAELDSAAIHPAAYAAAKNAARRHLRPSEVAASVAACLVAQGNVSRREIGRQVARAAKVSPTTAKAAVAQAEGKPKREKAAPKKGVHPTSDPSNDPPGAPFVMGAPSSPATGIPKPAVEAPAAPRTHWSQQASREGRNRLSEAGRALGRLVRLIEECHETVPDDTYYDQARSHLCSISRILEQWQTSLGPADRTRTR